MSTDTPEQRELALVGKVELRIALADSDTKLQALLNTYLPPLLLKLASDHEKVRFAVREELIPKDCSNQYYCLLLLIRNQSP